MRDKPIIRSRLDCDIYKYTMGYQEWLDYPNVIVKFAYVNRDKKIKLPEYIDIGALREQIDHFLSLRYTPKELNYFRSLKVRERRMFPDEYIDFLGSFSFPEYNLEIYKGEFRLEFVGPLPIVTFCETTTLSIMTQMYGEELMRRMGMSEATARKIAIERLYEKIHILKQHPEITFSDFGSRRRFSRELQVEIDSLLAAELPKQFLGMSNVEHAMLLGLEPKGTNAHQSQSLDAALARWDPEKMHKAPYRILRRFHELYGYDLTIALTDTFGTDEYLRRMEHDLVVNCRGYRQDSMEPVIYGEKIVAHLQRHGIDPMTRLLIFSDSLTLPLILKFHEHFRGRISTTNGWGTHLTNDLGLPVLKIVMKLIEADGLSAVKLSDNLEKAVGDPDEIRKYVEFYQYHSTYREEVTS